MSLHLTFKRKGREAEKLIHEHHYYPGTTINHCIKVADDPHYNNSIDGYEYMKRIQDSSYTNRVGNNIFCIKKDTQEVFILKNTNE